MKKTLIIGLITMLSLCLTYGLAFGGVSGPCVSCHTMHNSQDGTSMRYDKGEAPIERLLRGDCIGCHAQNTAFYVINGIPQVLHTHATTDLAGGNFTYGAGSDAKVHNVSGVPGITVDDAQLGDVPPGYAAATDPGTYNSTSNLVCAGIQGCHGIRNVTTNEWSAVSGAHHGNDSMLKFGSLATATQGKSVASSYRFLAFVGGGEETSWLNNSSAIHNEYIGKDFVGTRATNPAYDNSVLWSISELCASCHGTYHTAAGTTAQGSSPWGPWLRHPTDYELPATGEYASITQAGNYSVDAPVGRLAATINGMASPDSAVDNDADQVTCLSCHKAHGSDYPDILRWNYTTTLSAGQGCLYCHTQKLPYP